MGDHDAPELPATWRQYTKGIVAVTGGLAAAATPIAMGDGKIGLPELIAAIFNFLTAIGVIGLKNKGYKQ